MKRQCIELADVAERGNLALAACQAARGKRRRRTVAAWLAQADERLAALGRSIVDGSAPQGRATRFVIHDPKLREISAACFDDRVLHHAVMNLAADRFERALADSVYACRPGKGVHAAVAAVQRGLQRWPWVVQVDVAGYFASIDHAVLQAQLARLFKGAGFLALLGRIIRSGSAMGTAEGAAAGCGLPIGALTSQYFANHYLATADRLLLAHPGVRAHVRYMDDIVWFTESRAAAHAGLAALQTHLAEALHLQLKPGAQPRPSRPGLAFCGFRVRPGVVLASRRKLARARQQMRRLQRARRQGVPMADLQRAAEGWRAALLPAQTLHFRRRLWWPQER
jgi:hypothetical protein